MIRRTWLALGFAFLVTAVTATTVIPMSVERLTERSQFVVRARAVSSRPEWNRERTIIYTYTRFAVQQRLKGAVPSEVEVKQMGGALDGVVQKVAGVRSWRAGQEAVLFLQPSVSHDGSLVITGLMQGDYRVRRAPSGEAVVSNGVQEVEAFNARSRTISRYSGSRMSLQELETRVRTVVQR